MANSSTTNVTFLKHRSDRVSHASWKFCNDFSLKPTEWFQLPQPSRPGPTLCPVLSHLYLFPLAQSRRSLLPSFLLNPHWRMRLRHSLLTAQIKWHFWERDSLCTTATTPPACVPGFLSTLLLPPWGLLPTALWGGLFMGGMVGLLFFLQNHIFLEASGMCH